MFLSIEPSGLSNRLNNLETEPSVRMSNPRYPQYPALMEDGRNLTIYKPRCKNNINPPDQYNTKLYMVHNAEKLIDASRKEYEKKMGCSLKESNTVPPPAFISHQTPFTNDIYPTGVVGGIGLIRADSKVPPLFGTFGEKCYAWMDKKNIQLTTKNEGGRNTIR